MDHYPVKHLIYLGWQIMKAHRELFEIYYEQFKDTPFREELFQQQIQQAGCWERYFNFARENQIMQIFEKPEEVGKQFEEIIEELKVHQQELGAIRRWMDGLLIMYRAEFLMINPGLETLIYFGKLLRVQGHYDYQYGLNLLIKSSRREERIPGALELMGEALLKLYQSNQKQVVLQYTDQLTKVLRRQYFMNLLFTRADQIKGKEIGLMLIEVDYLQHTNMQFGYHEGDRLLARVAGIVKDGLRPGDIVGRYSNKQFIVVVEDIEWDHLFNLGNKIRLQVREELQQSHGITVSIGAVLMPVGEEHVRTSIVEMINEAEGRLFQVRTAGGGNILL